MKASKIIGILLIIASLFIGYVGIKKVQDNTNEINVLGIKIEASNESGQQQGYLYLGAAVIVFIGGILLTNKTR